MLLAAYYYPYHSAPGPISQQCACGPRAAAGPGPRPDPHTGPSQCPCGARWRGCVIMIMASLNRRSWLSGMHMGQAPTLSMDFLQVA
jgi:hypothetical protein